MKEDQQFPATLHQESFDEFSTSEEGTNSLANQPETDMLWKQPYMTTGKVISALGSPLIGSFAYIPLVSLGLFGNPVHLEMAFMFIILASLLLSSFIFPIIVYFSILFWAKKRGVPLINSKQVLSKFVISGYFWICLWIILIILSPIISLLY